MKKEYLLAAIFGMFLLSYLLDAIVDPPAYNLSQPYQYITDQYYSQYPLTTASVAIRSLAVFLTPVLLLSFISKAYTGKGLFFLIAGILMNLYAVQVLTTDSLVVPVEWALSLAFGGTALLIPAALFFLRGSASSFHQSIKKTVQSEALGGTPDWMDNKEE